MNDPYGILVAAAICVPAMVIALQRSSWLVDYLFFVIAFNRGIRRFVDYQNDEFNPYSLISITPLIVAGLAVLVVFVEFNSTGRSFSKTTKNVLICYLLAVSLAFLVGLFNAKFAAIYALGDYVAPVGLLGYGAIYANQPRVFDRWYNTIVILGLTVGVYGLWQFYTIPPWDAFWVRAVDFEGYLGDLEPTKMTLFSTLNERGPAAGFLCNSLIVLLLRPGSLNLYKPFIAAAIGFPILLTYVRTAIIQVTVALIVFPLINRGVGKWLVLLTSVVFFLFIEMVADSIPGASRVAARLSTLSDLPSDSSFQGRIGLINFAFKESLTEPLGLGIGSHGVGRRVSTIARSGVDDSSGYIQILRTFGWIGFVLIVYVFFTLWKCSSHLISQGNLDGNVMLFRAWFISVIVACFSGNLVMQPIFFWVLAGYCLEHAGHDAHDLPFLEDEDDFQETGY
jgi:putative inorganic carbon (HCO3(-)) transporter